MRVWVQSPGSSNICVREFILEFLSYIKNKKNKKKIRKCNLFSFLFNFFVCHIRHVLNYLLDEMGSLGAHPFDTPMDPNKNF
jgi:hypothetical protein